VGAVLGDVLLEELVLADLDVDHVENLVDIK